MACNLSTRQLGSLLLPPLFYAGFTSLFILDWICSSALITPSPRSCRCSQALIGEKLFGPVYIWTKGERIAGLTRSIPDSCKTVPLVEAALVLPGFVDIHTHGLGGCQDVSDTWSRPEHTQMLLALSGTTSFLASLVFKGVEVPSEVVATLHRILGKAPICGAVLEGIHAGKEAAV